MEKRLLEKGYNLEEINETLKFLERYNFINDESYTKAFIKNKTKTQGKQKIKYALKNKGVSEEIIEEELSNLDMKKEKEKANILALKNYFTYSCTQRVCGDFCEICRYDWGR